MKKMNEADRAFLRELMETYDFYGFTPQPASGNLRTIAKIITGRKSDQECVDILIRYLLLNGIPVDGRRPALDFPAGGGCNQHIQTEKHKTGETPMKPISIRAAGPADAAALLAIYAPYVEKTAVTFEYEVPTAAEFSRRIARTLERYPYLAAEVEGEILGYAYAGPFKERAAYDWAVETTVYVRRDGRRQGVGRALYGALERCLGTQGVLNLNACIASPRREDEYLTRDSIEFHRRMGWQPVGEFRQCGYKFGRWYDMVWMEKHIGPHLADQPPVRPFPEVRERFRSF